MTTYFGCIMSNKADRFYIEGIDDLSDVDRLIRQLCDQAIGCSCWKDHRPSTMKVFGLLGYA
jgi:hypothetical protein